VPGRDASLPQDLKEPHQRAHIKRTESLSTLEITPIALDSRFVDVLRSDIFLVEPTVEITDEPKLDAAVDPEKSFGCEPVCKQINMPRRGAVP
jgi:hypothetical protein